MNKHSFLHGVIVAAVLAFFASAIVATLMPFAGFGGVIRLVIPCLALAYLLYLFSRSAERTGRVTTLSLWSALAVATWWFAPPLPLYLLIHVGAVWLVRSLYFYSGVLPALLDLGLSGLSISAAVWAATRSGSVFLATWCFFLVQALFVTIPPAIRSKRRAKQNTTVENEAFDNARRQADRALRQLFTQ
ncbi:MAG: hypothetical protein QNJ07_14460 [Woeseiaceae bacterium]|nr:hypothetical protein [Woeseiaceae bacterium]